MRAQTVNYTITLDNAILCKSDVNLFYETVNFLEETQYIIYKEKKSRTFKILSMI